MTFRTRLWGGTLILFVLMVIVICVKTYSTSRLTYVASGLVMGWLVGWPVGMWAAARKSGH